MTERTCDYSKCDETFPRGGRRRYCCRLHKEKARKEDRGPHRPCAWCGTSFVTTGSRRYCSSGCSWAGARHIINAEKNAGSLDLRCRWIPPEPVERYRGAYYHALKADPCAYCGEPAGSIDHIDPSSRGGTNEHDNLTGACTSCGTFAITAIAAAEVPIQTEFFASEHRSLSELLADQGIAGPQGLNALVNDAQVPETDEDAFLAAIFAEDE